MSHLLLSHTTDPVHRTVLEAVVRYSDTQALMASLEERSQLARLTSLSRPHVELSCRGWSAAK